MEYIITHIYEINGQLVVASTIEKAIAIYKSFNNKANIVSITVKDGTTINEIQNAIAQDFDNDFDIEGENGCSEK